MNTGVMYMSLCEVRCCCTAAAAAAVVPLLLLLFYRSCTARVLLKFRGSGCNRPGSVQDGPHNIRTHAQKRRS